MKSLLEKKVEMTTRGLLYPDRSTQEENRLAFALINDIARNLGEAWEDVSHHEEVCVMLLSAFQKGQLRLITDGPDVVVVDPRSGEEKVRFTNVSTEEI